MLRAAAFILAAAFASPALAVDWSQAAKEDVEAAYRLTFENHPGPVDPGNPKFLEGLDRAKARGMHFAALTKDEAGYRYAILAFRAELRDGHAGAFPKSSASWDARPKYWPGFVAVWRGRAMYVWSSEVAAIPRGAEIIACDDKSIVSLLQSNVFAFGGQPVADGQWWWWGPTLFYDLGNPFVARPSQCLFDLGPKRFSARLNWQIVPAGYSQMLSEARNGPYEAIGLIEPRTRIFWIALPSFAPDEVGRQAYQKLFAALESRAEELRAARAVVLDLRGNGGGSSNWPTSVAEALWGKSKVEQARAKYFAGVEIWWRASRDNAAYVKARISENLGHEMSLAVENNEPFAIKRVEASEGSMSADVPFETPVYVITGGGCGSACLDGVDVFTRFDNTRLIGAPTSEDSNYMEIRFADVPSGRASVVIPNKIWVHRPRAAGAFYAPQIPVNDLDWSMRTFLERIEVDLARRNG